MIEFLIGCIIGAAAVIFAIRRYKDRDGKVAIIISRVTGATKEQ